MQRLSTFLPHCARANLVKISLVSICLLQEGRPGSDMPSSGFGPGFGSSSSEDTPPSRRGFNVADRHPSMHIAAQIASATQLTMVPAAAGVGPAGGSGNAGSGLPSILEVDGSAAAGPGDDGISAFANGSAQSVTSIRVEGE
jgi:hypothetical protein